MGSLPSSYPGNSCRLRRRFVARWIWSVGNSLQFSLSRDRLFRHGAADGVNRSWIFFRKARRAISRSKQQWSRFWTKARSPFEVWKHIGGWVHAASTFRRCERRSHRPPRRSETQGSRWHWRARGGGRGGGDPGGSRLRSQPCRVVAVFEAGRRRFSSKRRKRGQPR